jgi:ferredoxin
MKLRIDYDLCSGHGRCYGLVPELFHDDELGYGQVTVEDIEETDRVAAERAIASCPERAISLSE